MDTQSYNDKLNCFREKYQYITSKFPQISILKEHIDKALCTESAASIRPNLLQLCRIIEDTPMPPDVREELQTFFQHEHQGRMTFGSYLYGRFLAHVILAREAPETYVDLLLDHSNCLEGSGDALSEALGSDQRQNALQIFDILVDKCNIERTTERVYFPQKNDTVPHIFHMTDMSGTCSEEPLFLLFMMAKSNQDVFLQLLNRLRAPAHIDMLFHWVDASGSMDDLPGLLDLMDSCISGDNWTGALPVPMFAFSCHLLVSMHMQKQSMTEENAESFFRRFAVVHKEGEFVNSGYFMAVDCVRHNNIFFSSGVAGDNSIIAVKRIGEVCAGCFCLYRCGFRQCNRKYRNEHYSRKEYRQSFVCFPFHKFLPLFCMVFIRYKYIIFKVFSQLYF